MRQIFVCLLLAMVAGWADTPRDEQDWARLQTLKGGDRIEVVDVQMKSHRGSWVRAGDGELVLETGSGAMTMPRATVARVSRHVPGRRLRNAAIGAAIGAGAGLLAGAIADYRFSNEGREHIAKTLFTPIGAGVGAGLGAAVGGFETIYRAPASVVRAAQGRK